MCWGVFVCASYGFELSCTLSDDSKAFSKNNWVGRKAIHISRER